MADNRIEQKLKELEDVHREIDVVKAQIKALIKIFDDIDADNGHVNGNAVPSERNGAGENGDNNHGRQRNRSRSTRSSN